MSVSTLHDCLIRGFITNIVFIQFLFQLGSLVRFSSFFPDQTHAWLLQPSTCEVLVPASWAAVAAIFWLLAFLALQRYLQVTFYSATLKKPVFCYLACFASVLWLMLVNQKVLQNHGMVNGTEPENFEAGLLTDMVHHDSTQHINITSLPMAALKLKTCHQIRFFDSAKDSMAYTCGMFGLPIIIQIGFYVAIFR